LRSMPDKTITVIIPAHNEEETIEKTVRSAWSVKGVSQVLVIDDGSRDRTAQAARRGGAHVLSLNKNHGKGGAINKGAPYVRGEVVLIIDADLGPSASMAGKLVDPVLKGGADMTVAVFPPGCRKAGFGLVKGLAGNGIRYFTGLSMEAPLSGQRALDRELLLDLIPLAGGYGVEVDLTVRAAKKGCRIEEVPVDMFHRESGRDIKGFLHRGRQFIHVARAFLGLGMAGSDA